MDATMRLESVHWSPLNQFIAHFFDKNPRMHTNKTEQIYLILFTVSNNWIKSHLPHEIKWFYK